MSDHENESPESTAAVTSAVRDLIDMMQAGGIGELDLKTEDFKIRLRTETVALATATPVVSMSPSFAMPAMPAMAAGALAAESTDASSASASKTEASGHVVTSPMIGTFYAASAPGEPDYVQIGDEVETGQVVGIIEAMKIMNEITADQSGVVVEILVDNAQPVEYGSPLIRISGSAALD